MAAPSKNWRGDKETAVNVHYSLSGLSDVIAKAGRRTLPCDKMRHNATFFACML